MPTQLRPQGHDIIRTWAFYTILRTGALEGIRPWDAILINGMALGEDGHKMSKSLNNFIRPGRYSRATELMPSASGRLSAAAREMTYHSSGRR